MQNIPFDLDLGSDHKFTFTWSDDGKTKIGGIITHKKPDGKECDGSMWFDCEYVRKHFPGKTLWTVSSWEPLTANPSFLCHCGNHGWIRDGKWVTA
jgi:hypothetical protein